MTVPGSIKRFISGAWRREGTFILNVATVAALPSSPDEDGVFAFVAANQRMYYSVGGAWASFGTPVGATLTIPKVVAVPGWLYCDGSIKNIVDHPDLAQFLGSTYGGNGTTTFGMPDYRGRMLVNLDTAQTEFDVIGKIGGTKTHILAATELPSHTHTDTLVGPVHTHPMPHTHDTTVGAFVTNPGSGGIGTSAAGTAFKTAVNTDQPSLANTSGGSTTALTGAVGAQSGTIGQPHNNLQPFTVAYTIMKT